MTSEAEFYDRTVTTLKTLYSESKEYPSLIAVRGLLSFFIGILTDPDPDAAVKETYEALAPVAKRRIKAQDKARQLVEEATK